MNNQSDSLTLKVKSLIEEMTLEEKATFLAGSDFWHTVAIPHLGIPSVMVTDGPNGLRKQKASADHLGINDSVPTTCFPTAATTACSFDPDLLHKMGVAIGEECKAEEVGMILGPAANIKRSPLCGRNFEYFSEDPYLSGKISAALIDGIQSQNVGTSLKHYLANNQEKARLVSDSVIDQRAMNEIYLEGYRIAVEESQPTSIMCSYNEINGTYASDNEEVLNKTLRDQWGFKGYVVTDWGAMNDKVKSVKAGLDLEMPGPNPANTNKVIKAVNEKKLSMEDLDKAVSHILTFVLTVKDNKAQPYDVNSHHELAGQIAQESAVLLKKGSLPLKEDAKLAIIGSFAKEPRYQGAGSGKIHATKVTSLLDALDTMKINYEYSQGYEAEKNDSDPELINEAVKIAKDADYVIACVGLPDSYESEGFDRTHLNMPDNQNKLMDALIATGKPVVALVSTGSVIVMPWRDKVNSILLMYLGGQNSGTATADLLFGKVNPSGKLAETWPLSLEDVPCYKYFGNGGNVEYRESIYVGYRYYDKANVKVEYPFGYGLSYTNFGYSDLKLSKETITDHDSLTVSLKVKNTGSFAGKEVVQLYIGAPEDMIFKPVKELKSFKKVSLEPLEEKEIEFELKPKDFAFYNVNISDWFIESGNYLIGIGSSSKDLRLSGTVTVNSEQAGEINDYRLSAPFYYKPTNPVEIPEEQFESVLGHKVQPWRSIRPFTQNSTLTELESSELGKQIVSQVKTAMAQMFKGNDDMGKMITSMLDDMPLRQLGMMAPDQFSGEKLEMLLAALNQSDK